MKNPKPICKTYDLFLFLQRLFFIIWLYGQLKETLKEATISATVQKMNGSSTISFSFSYILKVEYINSKLHNFEV